MNTKKTKKKMTPDESIADAKKRGIKFGDYGGEDLFDDDGNFIEMPKIRITTMIDMDLKDRLKAEAVRKGTKYQTLMNQILKEHFELQDLYEKSIYERVEELEGKMADMEEKKIG